MRFSPRVGTVTSAVLLVSASLGGQTQQPVDSGATYTTSATAVLVDAVVRDKSGRPVLDLAKSDFEVSEDGVPQDVGSFTLVSKGTGIGIAVRHRTPDAERTAVVQPTGAPVSNDRSSPSVVALVFDALSAESLALCQQATLKHVGMMGETEAQIGVFETEPSVRVVQHYTRDTASIRAAVRRLQSAGTEAKQARDERLEQLRTRQSQMTGTAMDAATAAALGPGVSGNAPQVGQAEVQRLLLQSEMRMLRAFESLDRDHRGYTASSALLSILTSLQMLPGRKSLLFFSEGLPASPVLQGELQSVIESANRANITVYTVDATGLRVQSSSSETRKEVDALGETRLQQTSVPTDRYDEPLTRGMERTEDLMRYSGEAGLTTLAKDTGGFMVRDTNDIGSAFRRIDEDMRFHYLLSYSPKNPVYDGKFRTISVKVKRAGLNVFARKGYRAVRAPAGLPVLTFEAPALTLLDASPIPNAFPSQSAAYTFPEPSRPGLTPIVVRVTTDVLRYDVQPARSTYSGQAAVVVRIRDASGQVRHKLSQQYVLSGDQGELEAAKKGEILFYREVELPPGVYQVESMVFDANAERGSGRVSTLTVPEPAANRLRMSSLVLVSRTERTPGEAAKAGPKTPPFYHGDTLIYPNVGEPIQRATRDTLPFYFVVYPPGGQCECSAQISLLRNGRTLAEVTRALPATGEDRLRHLGELPIAQLPNGTYELRVTVSDSHDQQTQSAFFTLS
jgi:VWFA-related protein